MKKVSLVLLILISITNNVSAMGIKDWMLSWQCWCGLRCRRSSTRTLWTGVPNGGADAKQLVVHAVDTDELNIQFPQAGIRFEEKEED